MLNQPKIWLLDEPTASLDAQSERKVIEAISVYVKPQDILVIATHKPMMASALANRIVLMQRGMIIEDGGKDEVLEKMTRPIHKEPEVPPSTLNVEVAPKKVEGTSFKDLQSDNTQANKKSDRHVI